MGFSGFLTFFMSLVFRSYKVISSLLAEIEHLESITDHVLLNSVVELGVGLE
jgi:hypothetical protein